MVADALNARVPLAKALNCPSCGAALELRGMGWTVHVVCPACRATLDATDSSLRILQRAQDARIKPLIPLGTRGKWKDIPWEVIGCQRVTISVEGESYSWEEYVCFNPWRGFMYLSEYQGHWNVIQKQHRIPIRLGDDADSDVRFNGQVFRHFQTAVAYTTAALGEFPWELRVGDSVVSTDYVAPPLILSSEQYETEISWSLGSYVSSKAIESAFGIKSLPEPVGVFANQPNPRAGRTRAALKALGFALAAMVLMLVANVAFSSNKPVFMQRYAFTRGTDDSSAFVTDAFQLDGRPSSVMIDASAPLDNDWLFLSFVLVNETTGSVYEASRELSYYSGIDSDGRWSEGSRNRSVRIPSVPAGRYFLRIQPEGGEAHVPHMSYSIRVRRDAPYFVWYWIALALLVVPFAVIALREHSFEQARWMESDHAPATVGGDDDDDE